MRHCLLPFTGAAVMAASFAFAQEVPRGFDVYILGEFHDNSAHHAWQADQVAALQPKAVVYEMLTVAEAADLDTTPRTADAFATAISGMSWSNIADYIPVFLHSDVIVGAAVSSEDVRAAFSSDAASVFGSNAETYGLTLPLDVKQSAARQDLQFAAHCEAMSREMMAGMVEAQRLRDAAFARSVLDAVQEHGAPVVLITGNGHARRDWGVPSYLARVEPEVTVFSVGQSEGGGLAGTYDRITASEPQPRVDPCAAFR